MATKKQKIPDALPSSDPLNPLHEREVDKGLSAIYRDEGGAIPDLTKFEPLTSRWWLYALIAVAGFIVVLLAAAWAGFSIFKPFRGFSGQGLAVQIEGPERVALGQETTYFINYQNNTSDPIASSDLRVSFPSDFSVSDVRPAATGEGLSWNLGAIPVDGRGTITVKGTFTGAIGTVTAIQVVGTYRPASSRGDLEVLATKVLNYSDSVLQGTLAVPVKILPGDKVVFGYTIRNSGSEPFDGLVARFTLPDGFQPDAGSPDAHLEGRTLSIPVGSLASGASSTVEVSGAFSSGVSGEAHLVAETGRPAADGTFFASQRSETSFTVLAGDLSLKLVVNGQDADATMAYGGVLRIAVGYENTATEDLKDVRLSLHIESATTTTSTSKVPPPILVDWKTFYDSASGSRKGDVVTWTKDQIADLARLPPREDGSIDLSVNALTNASGTGDLAVRVYVEASIASVGDTKVNRVVRSSPIILRYVTDADIAADARYYSEEGAPLGSGPLPPVVGQATTYRVRWSVAKTVHELKGLTVKATLPRISDWTNTFVADAGEMAYDPETRTVTWTLNRLPSNVNESGVEFDVRVTPSESDANRFARILGETRFEATDADVNQTIVRTRDALTTDLQNDENAQAKGVVRKP